MENGQEIAQENSEKSENIQENTELNTENTSEKAGESQDKKGEAASSPDNDSQQDGELQLPEPDLAEDETKKKKEQPEWLKKRLERERTAAERKANEAEVLRQENERLKAAVNQPTNQPIPQNPQIQQGAIDPFMPQREAFNNDSEYFLALSDYREEKKNQIAMFRERENRIKEHEKEFQSNLTGAIESGKTKYKDFEERTDYILYGEGFPSNRAMAEAIVDSSYKDDILYFLGTHVKEAERIARLNPVSAAKEIAKIEVRFDSRKKSNITKAPKVLTPLTGGKGSATHGDPNKMGMDEFRQWYKDKFS